MRNKSGFSAILFSLILEACAPQSGSLKTQDPSNRFVPSTPCANSALYRSDGYGAGTGTQENPYLICTVDQFKAIQGDMNEKRFFKMTRDLDFSDTENLSMIGIAPFASIDGGNHHLKNIRMKHGNGYKDHGLFGQLVQYPNGNRDEIKNLIIENITILGTGSEDGGGVLAGANWGGLISNVHVSGIVKIEYPNLSATSWSTGGLVGKNSWIIEDSSFEGQVSGVYNVGGIAGTNDGVIRNSFFKGAISGLRGAGGIVGLQLKSGMVDRVQSHARVTANHRFGNAIGFSCPSDNPTLCLTQLFE